MYKSSYVGKNKVPSFLKNIGHIHFPALIYLMLQNIEIDSLEEISRISLPVLNCLNISICDLTADENKITTIKALRKADFRNLQLIPMFNNYVIDAFELAKMRISPSFHSLVLECYPDSLEQNPDARFLLKLEGDFKGIRKYKLIEKFSFLL